MAKATYENELVTAARNIARLQRKIAQHKKSIRTLTAELRRERVILRHLASRAQSVPSKVYGEGAGLRAPDSMKREVPPYAVRKQLREQTLKVGREDLTTGFEEVKK